jgi:hypothetical protein
MSLLRILYNNQNAILSFSPEKKWISIQLESSGKELIGLSSDHNPLNRTSNDLALDVGGYVVLLDLNSYFSTDEAFEAMRLFKQSVGIQDLTLTKPPVQMDHTAANKDKVSRTNSSSSDSAVLTNRITDTNQDQIHAFRNSYGATLIKIFWFLSVLGIAPISIYYFVVLTSAGLIVEALSVVWTGAILIASSRLICESISSRFEQTALLKQINKRLENN